MPKIYHELNEKQMVFTIGDLEGDLAFFIRGLEQYRLEYDNQFPGVLKANDFTIVGEKPNRYVQYPKNVTLVFQGDLTDKAHNKTDHQETRNIELIEIFNNTHKKNGSRMISLLGNRETTKLRLKYELNPERIQKVLDDIIDGHDLIWKDGNENFLDYLQKLPLCNDPDQRVLRQIFSELSPQDQKIHYAKWLLAHSCGAPELWDDLAKETNATNDAEVLTHLEQTFCAKNSNYANYLKSCQLGIQVGNVLFTHGGLADNSFTLPQSLSQILTKKQIKTIFGQDVPPAMAKDINQLLSALNLWYSRLMDLHFNTSRPLKEHERNAIDELIAMGLPSKVHHDASLINVECADENGYGKPLQPETHERLKSSGTKEPVTVICHGHKPASRQQFGITDDAKQESNILYVNADTSNYHQGQSAVTTVFSKENGLTHIQLLGVNSNGDPVPEVHLIKNSMGLPVDNMGFVLYGSNPEFFLGSQLDGFNIVSYDSMRQSFQLYQLNRATGYKPMVENRPAHEVYEQLGAKNYIKYAKEVTAQFHIRSIDEMFKKLLTRSQQISYHSSGAHETAQTLAHDLIDARNKYLRFLLQPSSNSLGVPCAKVAFQELCNAAVAKALPVLERDLSWGDYLRNLLKSIANTLIGTSNKLFGAEHRLFTPAESNSKQRMTQPINNHFFESVFSEEKEEHEEEEEEKEEQGFSV